MNDFRYNIRVRLKAWHHWSSFKFVLTLQELKDSLVAPYNKGDPIIVDGRIMALSEIDRITIKRVVGTSPRLGIFDRIMMFIFRPDEADIFDSWGLDVTEEFISGPPGYAAEESNAIKQHTRSTTSMRIFISHSSNDVEVAKALVDLLRKALNLRSDEIRCTSVDGYRMQAGVPVDERLRTEVYEAELLIGIITPTSLRSAYVMFELGARWGAEKPMIPLLASGVTPEHLGGPLAGINALEAHQSGQVHQLLQDAAGYLNTTLDHPSSYTTAVGELVRRSEESTTTLEQQSTNTDSVQLSEEAKELLVEATNGREGIILMVRTMGGLIFQANGKDFGEVSNRRSEAKWEQAIRDLLNLGLIEDPTGKDELFKATHKGFEVADELANQA